VKILAVDTALGACSVALLRDEQTLGHCCQLMDRGHAEALAPMVEKVMDAAQVTFAELDRLAVTTGPGTFSGQRVGIAFMRGLRVALRRPLAGITTLAAMAEAAKAETGLQRAVALHDARRDEVYLEVDGHLPPTVLPFDEALQSLRDLSADAPVAPSTPAPSVQETPENQPDKSRIKKIRIGAVLVLLLAAIVIWRVVRTPDIPDSIVALSGRIEGDDSAIASKASGRILDVRFREPAVFARRLHGCGGFDRFAECLQRNPRGRRDVLGAAFRA